MISLCERIEKGSRLPSASGVGTQCKRSSVVCSSGCTLSFVDLGDRGTELNEQELYVVGNV
jgi:hypothetical protein